MSLVALGKTIKSIRTAMLKMSQKEFYKLIGLNSTQQLSNIECGRCYPSAQVIARLNMAIDHKVDFIKMIIRHKEEVLRGKIAMEVDKLKKEAKTTTTKTILRKKTKRRADGTTKKSD